MTTPITDEASLQLKAVAMRLREIQAATKGETGERRREILREELSRSFSELPPEARKKHLELLLARFTKEDPVPEEAQAIPVADEKCTAAPTGQQTAEECLSAFLEAASGIDEERRQALAKKLAGAGFNWVDRDQLLLEVAENLRETLRMPAGQQPRLTRMVQLSVVLIELLNRLDQMVLKTFNELSPRSGLTSRAQEFREAAANYLSGGVDSLDPQIRALSALVGGLMAAMLGAGRDFGRHYLERFSPSSIEDVVKGEGKVKLFGNEKALCWDKYKDLARDYGTLELIDRKFRETLGAFAEKKASAAR